MQRIYGVCTCPDVKPPDCQNYQKGLGVQILKHVRGENNMTNEEKQCAHSVTFQEFLNYFTSKDGAWLLEDPHWNKYYKKCYPCMLDYDFHLRLETGESDQEFFVETLLQSKQVPQFTANQIRFNNKGKSSEQVLAENDFVNTIRAYADGCA